MPAYYFYKCTECGYERERYRNVKVCPKCKGELKRMKSCFDCKYDKMCQFRTALTEIAKEMGQPIINYNTEDGEKLITYFMKSAEYCHSFEEDN